MHLSTRENHAGKPVRAAYEDFRLRPTSSILREIDKQDPIFPSSSEFVHVPESEAMTEVVGSDGDQPVEDDLEGVDESEEESVEDLLSMFQYLDEDPEKSADEADDEYPEISDIDSFDLPPIDPSFFSEIQSQTEEDLWRCHPSAACFQVVQDLSASTIHYEMSLKLRWRSATRF